VEGIALAAGAFAGPTTPASPSLRGEQAQRFETLLQSSSANQTGSSWPAFGDRYVDEVPPPEASSSARGIALPDDFMSLGRTLSSEFAEHRSKASSLFDEGESTIPAVARFREQLGALTELQQSFTQYHLMMKGVELSSQGLQQLFKMQG
jgi:hypothetical protein